MLSLLCKIYHHCFLFLNCLFRKPLKSFLFGQVTPLSSTASLFLAPTILLSCLLPFLAQYEDFSLCFILILEVKWPSCTSGSNRWQRRCSLVVLDCDENPTSPQRERKLLRSGFVCKYKSIQKREPEIVSELECFLSPVLDMDYIFLIWGLFVGHLLGERDSVAVRKWSRQTVGCEDRLGCRGKARGFTGCWRRWSQKGMRNVRIVICNRQTGF